MVSIEELEIRMKPGAYSMKGFLGAGEKLTEVIAHDSDTLNKLDLDREDLADGLEGLLNVAIESRKEELVIGLFEIHLKKFRHYQKCPWSQEEDNRQCTIGGPVQYGSLDWEIKNRKINLVVSGPGLIVHLIRDHHFFEGLASPYRVDPLQLAKLLELV
ncbi:MAG TPA: hypothetical protein VK489_04730 [Ferruginibacter sp.]|nr:hypothetical protein [Ferruginibacter sp.]